MPTSTRKRPDYGIDGPYVAMAGVVVGLAGILVGVTLAVFNPSSPYFSIPFTFGVAGLGYGLVFVVSSKVGKILVRDKVLEIIDWKGDEMVLDVGCGRGLLLIGAAKRLKTGKAIGIDIWRRVDQSGHHPELTLENARLEGVEDRVEVRQGDARNIPFESSSFDVVLSGLVIHNIPENEQAKALEEIVRVLKPGGKLAIFDIWRTGSYARILNRLGMQGVKLSYTIPLFLSPTRILAASKQANPKN